MGCGASSAKAACSPDATSTKTASKSAGSRAPNEPRDPELLQLLEAHGLVEQLPDLQALGVSKPAHLSDLLVEDLEEVGLSRVQIRQLQRAVAQDPTDRSSPSAVSPLRLRENGTSAVSPQELPQTPKEFAQHSGIVSKRKGRDTTHTTPVQVTSKQEDVPRSAATDAHKDEHEAPLDGIRAGASSSGSGRFAQGYSQSASSSVGGLGGRHDVKPKGAPSKKPPLYKQTQKVEKVQRADANGASCLPPADQSSRDPGTAQRHLPVLACEGVRQEPPHRQASQADVGEAKGHLGGRETHDHEQIREQRADSEDSRASSVDFDVTLLPEVTLPQLKGPQVHEANKEEGTPLLMSRQDPFGAGPQPSVGRDAPAPSAQLPPAVRQRLEAREEARRAQRSRDVSSDREVSERVQSPPRREPRSTSERPSVTRVHTGPRAASLGAASRQMFNKNELRAAHRALFTDAIAKYQAKLEQTTADLVVRSPSALRSSRVVDVYVRKRPLFPHEETKRNDFDVVSVLPRSSHSSPTQVILHNCLFQADLRTPVIHHLRFAFDHVFDDEVSDEHVYKNAAMSLVESAKTGHANTILMFGQTGSGKTHTIKAIERLAAHDLFISGHRLSLSVVELRGSHCFDLLLPNLPELRLRELREQQSAFIAEGAHELHPQTPEDLVAAFEAARQRRATSATEANDESSRSHAICSIRLFERSGGSPAGSLTLVDCAGTERRKDSANHSKERQQEGAEINASLHALKECIRFMSKRQRIPPHAFRASALTKLLATSLCSETRLSVICTIAPAASDTEHTLSTLRTGATLRIKGSDQRGESDVQKEVLQNILTKQRDLHPRQWSPQQVQTWLTELEDGNFADVSSSLPTEFTGQMLVRLSEGHCVQLCGSEGRGRLLFDLLHKAIRGSDQSR